MGLRSLEEACSTRLGEFTTRLREYSFAEIKERNAAGEALLIVDGMVLDVTRWLPEHPGGSTIIPSQALNMDAARFYEIYHASRESFLYVRHFYIGAQNVLVERPVRGRLCSCALTASAPPSCLAPGGPRRGCSARPRAGAAAGAWAKRRFHRAAQALHALPARRHRRVQELLTVVVRPAAAAAAEPRPVQRRMCCAFGTCQCACVAFDVHFARPRVRRFTARVGLP
jgi:hypothetical protein